MVGLVPSCPPKCVLWTEIIILTLSTSYNCLSWSGYIRILTWGLPLTEWSDLCHVSASIREQWGLGGVQTGIQTANNRNTFAFNCQNWGQSQTEAVSGSVLQQRRLFKWSLRSETGLTSALTIRSCLSCPVRRSGAQMTAGRLLY